MAGNIENRKREHIDTVLRNNVSAKGVSTGFERYYFEHVALPEMDLDAIDTSLDLFGKRLALPMLISSMTGGTSIARDINLNLAEAAQSLGIAMGVGSQRAAIEEPMFADTYSVRSVAPDILLFANLGAVQLNYGYGPDQAKQAVEMIEANALFLHLNPLQEAVQPGGDCNWTGLLNKIAEIVVKLDVPVVVKEVGNGISKVVACRLANIGVAAIDIAGMGGTSWSEVESHRQGDPVSRRVAHSFAGWGIPTAQALQDVCAGIPGLPVFASGGIRSGIDVAKAIRLGATLAGVAAPTLGSAVITADAVNEEMVAISKELRIAMFCTGSDNLKTLKTAKMRRAADGLPL